MNTDYRPKKKRLIRPGLQFRLVGVFSALVAMAALFQTALLAAGLEASLPEQAREGFSALRLHGIALGVTLAIWIPVVAAVGVAVTHRIAGPVHRFETHLRALAEGENPGPCRIRPKDELQGLGKEINAAVDRMRLEARSSARDPMPEGDGEERQAA